MSRLQVNFSGTLDEILHSQLVVAGNRILLRGGTYYVSNDLVPTLHDVTLMAYPGETVTIKSTGGSNFMLLLGSNSYNMTIADLILEGDAQVPIDGIKITDGSSGNTITNCEIKNFPGQGILMTNGNGTTENILIEDCHVHHNGVTTYDHNVYASITGLTIKNSEFSHSTGWGIHCFDGQGGDIVTIEQCYCHDNYIGIGAYYGAITVKNCVSRNNAIYSISVKYSIQVAHIQFNTCIGQVVVDELIDNNPAIEIVNNVILSEDSTTAFFLSGRYGMTTAHYNLIHGAVTDLYLLNRTYTTEENNLYQEYTPLTDDSSDNIKPLSGNPAIGAGINISGITSDYGDNLRSDPPTMGAWE